MISHFTLQLVRRTHIPTDQFTPGVRQYTPQHTWKCANSSQQPVSLYVSFCTRFCSYYGRT